MTSVAAVRAFDAAKPAPAPAPTVDADKAEQASLSVRLGTIAVVGGTITGLSALVGMKSVATKAMGFKGAMIGGLIGAAASAAIIAATGLATRSGGAFGSGGLGNVGGFSGPPFSG